MDSCVNLDPSVFPYQDIRYTGRETGTKLKTKKDIKLAPIFIKPKVPMPGSVVVPKPIGEDSTIGKPTGGVTPSGSGGADGSSVGGDSSCPSPSFSNNERSVVKYTPPVNNKGMCCS